MSPVALKLKIVMQWCDRAINHHLTGKPNNSYKLNATDTLINLSFTNYDEHFKVAKTGNSNIQPRLMCLVLLIRKIATST